MFPTRAVLALGLSLLGVVTSAAPAAAQEGGKPKLLRVLYDRRVDFPLSALTLSRDGKRLASIEGIYAFGVQPQYRVIVADVATGRRLRELPMHTTFVNRLALSPDGKVVYAGVNVQISRGQGGTTLVAWDVDAGKRLHETAAADWDLSPDGRRLALVENWVDIDPGSEGRQALPPTYTVRVLDTTTWKEVSRLHEVGTTMSALRFSPNGRTLALSVPPYSIRLWDWQPRKEKLRFEATRLDAAQAKLWVTGQVNTLAFDPDGTILATITEAPPDESRDPLKIDLWDARTGKRLRSLEGSKYRPAMLAFTPQGDRIALADVGNRFHLIDATTGKVVRAIDFHGQALLAATLYQGGKTPEQLPDGPPLLGRLWKLASSDDTRAGDALEHPQCLAFAPDHRTLAVGDNNGFIHLADVATGKELHRLNAGRGTIWALFFLEDGKLLCSQSRGSGVVRFWDVPTGKPLPFKLAGAPGGLASMLVASPDGKLAAGSYGGAVLLWNRYDDRKPRRVKCPSAAELLQFTSDGNRLLAAAITGNPEKVQVIDVAAGTVVGTIGDKPVATFGVTPDGSLVASWGRTMTSPWVWDKTVRLWDLSGASRGEVPVTPSAFNGLRFTPDGRCLFVEQDGGLGLWDIAARKLRTVIPGHWPLAISGDGRFVVSTGSGCLFVWDLAAQER